MTKNHPLAIIFIALLAVTATSSMAFAANSSTNLQAAPRPPVGPKPACRIEIDDAHISSSNRIKNGFESVKVNAQSICNFHQQRVDLTVQIYKTTYFGNRLVQTTSTNPLGPSSSGLVVNNFATYASCRNSNMTTYYGVAFSQALIDGRIESAGRTRSVHLKALNCGT